MKFLKWAFGALAVVVAAGLVYVVVMIAYIAFSIVTIKELQRVPSPDGKRVAVLELRDGGATTGTNYLVYLHDMNDWWVNFDDVVFEAEFAAPLELVWRGNNELAISGDHSIAPRDLHKQLGELAGCVVVYNDKLKPPGQ